MLSKLQGALVLLLLAGCSTLKEIAPETTALACMGADVATTVVGREAYGLREANPLVKNYAVLVGSKIGVYLLVKAVDRWVTPVSAWTWYGVAIGNCGIATWNGAQIAGSKE